MADPVPVTPEQQAVLAQPLLQYFTQTYGTKVWVVDHDQYRKGRLAWYMDFSSTLHNPFYAEALPEHERRWFCAACQRDYWGSYAADKGTPFVFYEGPGHQDVTDEFPKVLL